MGFELSEVQEGAYKDPVLAFICTDHGEMRPVCDVEIYKRKAYMDRPGKRPKVVWETWMRLSCKVCKKYNQRRASNVFIDMTRRLE